MYVPKHFEAADVAWCHDLMRREPFAILVGVGRGRRPVRDPPAGAARRDAGAPRQLLGHVARPNPQWQLFAPDRPVLVVFPGAHAYVSPSLYAQHPSVPTWNYVAVHAYGVPRVIEDPGRGPRSSRPAGPDLRGRTLDALADGQSDGHLPERDDARHRRLRDPDRPGSRARPSSARTARPATRPGCAPRLAAEGDPLARAVAALMPEPGPR